MLTGSVVAIQTVPTAYSWTIPVYAVYSTALLIGIASKSPDSDYKTINSHSIINDISGMSIVNLSSVQYIIPYSDIINFILSNFFFIVSSFFTFFITVTSLFILWIDLVSILIPTVVGSTHEYISLFILIHIVVCSIHPYFSLSILIYTFFSSNDE
jgi:hypothetical protein